MINIKETAQDKKSFEEREAAYYKKLKKEASLEAIFELASIMPGEQNDAPFAPVDPALHKAALRLAKK